VVNNQPKGQGLVRGGGRVMQPYARPLVRHWCLGVYPQTQITT
jgi:hypothetical protein